MTKLFASKEIESTISSVASQLSTQFADKDNITALIVLNGAMFFAVDLLKQVNFSPTIDFCKINTYINNQQLKQPKWFIEPHSDLTNQHIIIIEDIVDSGNTMKFIINELYKHDILSCTIVSLLKRSSCTIDVDYVGFEVPDGIFVYGYGMDNNNTQRNLKSIYKL